MTPLVRAAWASFLKVLLLLFSVSLAVSASLAAPFEPLDHPRPIEALDTRYLPEMTSLEVRDAIAAGRTTVLVPTGGIEQNGPFLSLDKHDRIARRVAEEVAERLDDALVAPVVGFVPQGRIAPAEGHMRYAGTISMREDTFRALLEDVAGSLRAHGFRHVVFLGDSGGNQAVQQEVAARLDRRWARSGTRVHHIGEAFYDPEGANAWLAERGLVQTPDAFHDDLGFTLQLLAIDPQAARFTQRRAAGLTVSDGVDLEPVDERIALGEGLIAWRADRTAAAIEAARMSAPLPRAGVRHALATFGVPLWWVVDSRQRVFVGYLLTALLIALFAEIWRQGWGWNIRAVAGALFPRRVWLSRDARQDVLYALVNGALMVWLLTSWTSIAVPVQAGVEGALTAVLGPTHGAWRASVWVVLACTLVTVALFDFAVYAAHWLQHRVPFLWAFHKVHHAARELTPLTVYRQHPLDFIGNGILVTVASAASLGALGWLTGGPVTVATMGGLNLILAVFYLAGYNLRHSHYWVDFGPVDHLVISPAMHQIHHSEAERHFDRNLGLIFSVWDRLFGTLYIPKEREALRFGIGPESARYRNVWDFYVEPFREVLGFERPIPEEARPISDEARPAAPVAAAPVTATPAPARAGG